MKRIIVCMDGTWQSLNQDNLTNIGIIARSVAHKETLPDGSTIHQTVIYTHGVGSSIGALARRGWLEDMSASFNRFAGGAFGEGLEDGIVDTYLRLAFDYEPGDQIFIFGFSRGAFAARRLAGFIGVAGIVSRRFTHKAREGFRLYYDTPGDHASDAEKAEHAEAALQFRRLYGKGDRNDDGTRRQTDAPPPIRYVGVFDTVAQRGFGDVIASFTPWKEEQRYRFKNYRIGAHIENARHAVALDEARIGFPVLLWEGLEEANQNLGRRAYEQRWFIGTHGDVGGGEGSRLAAASLKWIAEGARDAGLRFYGAYGDDRSPLEETLNDAGMMWDGDITRPKFWKALQPLNYPWRGRRVWTRKERPTLDELAMTVDHSVLMRAHTKHLRYRPAPLKPFRNALKDWQPPAS